MFHPRLLCLALLVFCLQPSTPTQAAEKAAEKPVAKSARWEKEIAAFETADRANPPAKGGIVFVGSSSIRKWTSLAADFPAYPVLNRGFGGRATTIKITWRREF